MTGNVLFDFDGTLFDTFPGIKRCVNYALKKTGRSKLSDETLRNFLGPPIYSSMDKYAHLTGEEAEEAVRIFREEYESRGIYESKPYPGMEELLRKLSREGVKLCVASSKPLLSIHALLQKYGLRDCFTRVCGADKELRSEDKRELLMNAMIQPDAVMVGDRMFDMRAAKALNLTAVGVTYGFGLETELLESGADFLAADTSALEDLLCKLLRRQKIL